MAEIDNGATSALVSVVQRLHEAVLRLDESAAENPELTPRKAAHIDAILRDMERAKVQLRRLIVGHAPVVEGIQRLNTAMSLSVIGSDHDDRIVSFPHKADNLRQPWEGGVL